MCAVDITVALLCLVATAAVLSQIHSAMLPSRADAAKELEKNKLQ